MTEITNAFAQLQKSGTEKIVFAHQEHSDQIASHVQHLKFGITTQINASAQQLLMDLTVPPVLHQDHGTLTLINVCAQLKESGMAKNVFVEPDYMEQTVFHALPQDLGISTPTNVYALPKEYGTVKNVFVEPDYTEQIVSHAHHLDIGIVILTNAHALRHLSGILLHLIANVLNHTSCTMENVLNVQAVSSGLRTDVNNVTAISPSYLD